MKDAPQSRQIHTPVTDRQPGKPWVTLFAALAVTWFFPSAIAISFLKPEPRTGVGYFRNAFETVATLDWFGWLLLAPAFIFAALALYFCWKQNRLRANANTDRYEH